MKEKLSVAILDIVKALEAERARLAHELGNEKQKVLLLKELLKKRTEKTQ